MEQKKKLTLFGVYGPFEIHAEKGISGAKVIRKEDAKLFWTSNDILELGGHVGCYVFGMRAGKGFRPAYVGSTLKNFRQEALKLRRSIYNEYMASHSAKGTPCLFFLTYPRKKGNKKYIGELEMFLISSAAKRNKLLINVHGTRGPRWGIDGVIRGSQSRPSEAAREFKKLFFKGRPPKI